MKSEIRQFVCMTMERTLDPHMANAGFTRRRSSFIYSRRLNGSTQKIDTRVQLRPTDRDAAAAIYPTLRVSIPAITEVLRLMCAGRDDPLFGNLDTTVAEPVAFVSPHKDPGRWFLYQADSVEPTLKEIAAFINRWAIPFLDRYSTPQDVCAAYDSRVPITNVIEHKLRVVCAMLICGRRGDAAEIAAKWFGTDERRRSYACVFAYLDRIGSHTQGNAPR